MALLQSRSASQAAGPATQSLAFSSIVISGSGIIVVGGSLVATDVLTISDGAHTYSYQAAILNSGMTAVFKLFYVFNVSSGALTVTLGGLTGPSLLAIHEFSGGISSFDVASSSAGIGNSQDSGTINTAQLSETLFGFTAGKANTVSSITKGASFSLAESSAGSNGFGYLTQYQLVSAKGAYDSVTTTTVGKGGTFDWAAQIAGFVQSASSDWQLGGRHHSSRIILPGRGLDG